MNLLKQSGILTTGAIIGILITYFLLRSDISISARQIPYTDSLTGKTKKVFGWQPIPPPNDVNAKNWMGSYYDESQSLWYPLEVDNNRILRGFYIDKGLTDAIYAQNPLINGFRIYLGKRPDASRRNYCLIFVGTKSSVLTPDGYPEDYGTYYDYVDPCPRNCGTSINFMGTKK